jgi:4-hydroxybenzoyl-CoA reductase subunit beta
MLPLPIFALHKPTSLPEAIALLQKLPRARLIAGGTDVLPNMKQGLFEPEHLVSVTRLPELRGIALVTKDDGREWLEIGAGMHLDEIADSVVAKRLAPALAEACGAVGGPHHRAMGTIGGNVCLDTRCRYYNQTYFWRKALGFCLKKDGTVCHVVKGGAKCVAAASNDSAPALIALDGTITLLGPKGERTLGALEFYTADGIKNTVIEPDEIVVKVGVPIVAGRKSAFEKLRKRGAIDFPLLSIAARVDRVDDKIGALDVVVSALGARPRRVRAAAKINATTPLDSIAAQVADGAFAECKPLTNLDEEAEWRREMVRVHVKKAVLRLI